MSEVLNGVVESTLLGKEDHGIPTCQVFLKHEKGCQRFGSHNVRVYGYRYIGGILEALEVSHWEKLPGTHCRVRATHDGIQAIGHFMKDQWFVPADLQAEVEAERKGDPHAVT